MFSCVKRFFGCEDVPEVYSVGYIDFIAVKELPDICRPTKIIAEVVKVYSDGSKEALTLFKDNEVTVTTPFGDIKDCWRDIKTGESLSAIESEEVDSLYKAWKARQW